jgi:hypothetical protein
MMSLRIVFIFFCLSVTSLFCFAQDDKGNLEEDVPSQGALNAIKRAYQMTDLCFTPLDSFVANSAKTYYKGGRYQGLVYSSVKETHTFVGMDVSFHTFMTALHNPRSVMYTENVSKPPYHGHNCGAYYGTVCSGLTTYALGLKIYQKSHDFANSEYFQLVEDQSSRGVRLADVINSGGHVQLVTRIKRNSRNGRAEEIEICEGVRPGCRRVILSGEKLDKLLSRRKKPRKLYRYKYLDSVKYVPLTDFVAVGDERLKPYKYNNDICTNRGDKACYITEDSVILNIAKGYKELEIYKDSILYKTIEIGNNLDIVLRGLTFGDYKARLVKGKKRSDYTYWKVIDTNVSIDQKRNIVKFHSENAIPVYAEFCSLKGGRPTKGIFDLSNEEVQKGYVDVSSFSTTLQKTKYVKVHFECSYGRVTNKPIIWRIKK